MKEILLKSLKLYGQLIVAGIMCFILVITFNVLSTGIFTEKIGYTVYGTKEGDESQTELYTYYYADGEDTKKQEYTDNGYTFYEVSIRSEINKSTDIIWDCITEFFLIILYGIFVYNSLWNLGFKDSNMVRINRKKEDKLKGLKIGALASLPSYILLTVLLIGKNSFASGFSVALFSTFNAHLYQLFYFIAGGLYFAELSIIQIIAFYALLLVTPLIAFVSYILGYKSILVSDKLIYKKNKERK